MNYSKILILLSLLISLSYFVNSISIARNIPARISLRVKGRSSPDFDDSSMTERGITEWRFKREMANSIENDDDSIELNGSAKIFVSFFFLPKNKNLTE